MSTTTYAQCLDCTGTFSDRAAMENHLEDTFGTVKDQSHTVQVLNPTPTERAGHRIRAEVNNAIDDTMTRLGRLVSNGEFTKDQVADALTHFSDFGDAWDEYHDDE